MSTSPTPTIPHNQLEDMNSLNWCYEFVIRLHDATKKYEEALRREFVYSEVSRVDWGEMLRRLFHYPLRQFLQEGASLGSAFVTENEKYHEFVEFELVAAITALQNKAIPHLDAIFAALRRVTDARFALSYWRDKLSKAGAVRRRYDWSSREQREKWIALFDDMIEKLRKAIDSKVDLEICRFSRQTHLYREYLYIVAPNEIARCRDSELIRLHKEAIPDMKPGLARDHSQERLDDLEEDSSDHGTYREMIDKRKMTVVR